MKTCGKDGDHKIDGSKTVASSILSFLHHEQGGMMSSRSIGTNMNNTSTGNIIDPSSIEVEVPTTADTISTDSQNVTTAKKNDNENIAVVSAWTPSTTYLLLNNKSPSYNVLDHVFGLDFHRDLKHEMEITGVLNKLSPSKTAMDHIDDVRSTNNNDNDASSSLPLVSSILKEQLASLLQSPSLSSTTATSAVTTSIKRRGDYSTFIPRSYRNSNGNDNCNRSKAQTPHSSFTNKHPKLHYLISSIQNTVQQKLGTEGYCYSYCNDGDDHSAQTDDGAIFENPKRKEERKRRIRSRLQLDLTQTSVQVASYPGDGKSGYVRHCDRGGNVQCTTELEPELELQNKDSSTKGSPQRIITVIYYLTNNDWDEDLDGGCLRVYNSSSLNTYTSEGSSRGGGSNDRNDTQQIGSHHDIVPHADRLVIFRSDVVEHEVLPSKRRSRLAITIWFYGRFVMDKYMDVKNEDILNVGRNISNDKSPLTYDTNEGKYRKSSDCNVRLNVSSKLKDGTSGPSQLQIERKTSGDSFHRANERIFVSIPSYRDSETLPTVQSLISNAAFPNRVYIGVVFQIDTLCTATSDEHDRFIHEAFSSLPTRSRGSSLSSFSANFLRTIILDYRHATGPCYARYLAQSLHRGEEYILQIDSHMRFRKNWDAYLIQQLHKCQHPYRSVLTTYPPGYSLPNDVPWNDPRGTVLVPWKFDCDGMLRQKGRLLKAINCYYVVNSTSEDCDSPTDQPQQQQFCTPINCKERNRNLVGHGNNNIPCLLYAAGFNFSSSSVLHDCPYDLNLHHLFFGEELSMAVRLFTHGYDLFSPPETVCYHLWSRDHRRTFQTDFGVSALESKVRDNREKETDANINDETTLTKNVDDDTDGANNLVQDVRMESMRVVKQQLMGVGRGLGSKRTADEFASKLRVDFSSQTIHAGAENGGLDPSLFASGKWSNMKNVGADDENDDDDDSADKLAKLILDIFVSE